MFIGAAYSLLKSQSKFQDFTSVTEETIHNHLVNAGFIAALGTFISLMKIKAPYGKHYNEGWGKSASNKLGWTLMEIPSVIIFATTFIAGKHANKKAPAFLALLWLTHYSYRTFIYPRLIRSQKKPMPLSIVLSGALFNTYNSYINARSISHFSAYPNTTSENQRLLFGAIIFAIGMVMNIHSDQILINLRKEGDKNYYIPNGGMFNYVSSPNYLGELIEWTGFAIAAWSKPGLIFALYTAANLVPRANENHKWYLKKFGSEYEDKQRDRIIPGMY